MPAVLVFPSSEVAFIVEMVASSIEVGVVLYQKHTRGRAHPIPYDIRAMINADRKYTTCERDALAVAFALRQYRVCLLSSEPIARITDHQVL